MPQTNKISVYDFDSAYEEGFSKDVIISGKTAIINFLLNLLSTNSAMQADFYGDRVYEPTFGSNLEYKLFEPVTQETADSITDIIYTATKNFLPELNIARNMIGVKADEENQGYKVIIFFVWNNIPDSLKFTIK